jgi:hypothetical protein
VRSRNSARTAFLIPLGSSRSPCVRRLQNQLGKVILGQLRRALACRGDRAYLARVTTRSQPDCYAAYQSKDQPKQSGSLKTGFLIKPIFKDTTIRIDYYGVEGAGKTVKEAKLLRAGKNVAKNVKFGGQLR